MGFLDKFRAQATKAVDEHGDQIAGAVEKIGDTVDKKTGGKYKGKVRAAEKKADSTLDGLDGKDDDIS